MKILYTKHFPPFSFHAINLFGILIVNRRNGGKMSKTEINHELIHTRQQIEMLWLPFFIWYIVEFLVRLMQYRGNGMKAYYNISFEREAYSNMRYSKYIKQRNPYNWIKYLIVREKAN